MLNCAGYFTRATFARLGICVNGRSPLGFPYAKYRCIAPRNALVPGYARPHPTASRFSPFHAAFPSPSIDRKSHAECFANVSIVTSRPQQRVLIREMYSLSPGNVVLSSRSIHATRSPMEVANRQVLCQRDRFAPQPVTWASDLIVTAPENVRHAYALPLQQRTK